MMNNLFRYVLIFVLFSSTCAADNLFGNSLEALKTAVKHKDAFIEIDEPKEIELGSGMSAQLLGAAKLLDNPEIQAYVNKIGMWLVFQTERTQLPWRFGVLDEDTVNAFAAPGGYIFISKGLFMLFRNESELAGVLAHEIGHVLVKHHLKDIQENARNELLKDIGGKVIDAKVGAGWNQVVKVMVNNGIEVWESGLNREDEFEADELGVVIAARAGYDPYGLLGVLDTLSRVNPQKDNAYQQMHATHPPANERLELLEEKMEGKMEGYAMMNVNSQQLFKFQDTLDQ